MDGFAVYGIGILNNVANQPNGIPDSLYRHDLKYAPSFLSYKPLFEFGVVVRAYRRTVGVKPCFAADTIVGSHKLLFLLCF